MSFPDAFSGRAAKYGNTIRRLTPSAQRSTLETAQCSPQSHDDDDTSGVLVNYYTRDLDDPVPLP
eukprot:COSAG01_NODE_41354_length_452_cov_2.014164_1_plen_64_part_10